MEIAPSVWKVREELKKHLEVGKRYVLAVSGGADSLALADAMAAVFGTAKVNLFVCHVEHGIRGPESLADAKLVEEFCRLAGLQYVCHRVQAVSFAEAHGLTLEEAARKLRYGALSQEAEKWEAAIVTAHQADDQAETVLWKLLRGAGSEGLSGMQPVTKLGSIPLLRPLLGLSRADLEAYCEARGLRYCQDSTNSDLHYTRNRIRKELLPYLEKHFNVAIKATLVREAQLLTEEQECLAELTEQYLQEETLSGVTEEGYWIDAMKLKQLPAALRKRILRQLYFQLGGKELSFERTQALDNLALEGVGGKVIQLPGAFQARYHKRRICLVRSKEL